MGSKISTHRADPGVSHEEDRISTLPDHLLHNILSFVPAQDAVRTGVLSRRWQRVWIDVPTLAFSDDTRSTTGFANSLEKVLAGSHGHRVDVLNVSIRHPLHIARANAWLQQAVERVHGSISISFVFPPNDFWSASAGDRVVLDLPSGGRTTVLSLDFSLDGIGTLRVPPASAAVSSSLTELRLTSLRLDGSSFSDLVSSCCPHLRKLFLRISGDIDYLRLSNDALEDLDVHFTSGGCGGLRGLRQLQVSSRNLSRLRIHDIFSPEVRFNEVYDGSKVASFRTPRLEHLFWTCSAFMHPSRIEFADSLATVRRLDLTLMTHAWVGDTYLFHNKLAVWLLRHCTGVRCLKLGLWNFARDPMETVHVLDEASLAQYKDLMVSVPQLSSVVELTVLTMLDHHAYGASIASLLSRCNYVERLTIVVRDKRFVHDYACVDAAMCWCKCPANWTEQKLRLNFLRQVDFRGFKGTTGWMADLSRLMRSSETKGASEDSTTPLVVHNYT